jgi:dihydrodipicolinate synthase/N-acetylneuraminate lyase
MISRRDFSKSMIAAGTTLLASGKAFPADSSASVPSLQTSYSNASDKSTAVRGFVGTPVTPFTSDDKIDSELYQRIVDFLTRKGADAIAAPMHMGEALSMTVEERKRVAKLLVEAVNGRKPVFIHCSLSGTREVIDLAKHAQSIGAQGVVVVTPYFYHPGNAALVDHFVSVARSIDISVIIYRNVSVGELPLEVLAEVVRTCPNVIGIKEGGHEMGYFTEACRMTNAIRPGFRVFDGVENVATTVPVGGSGCFSPISDLAPQLVKSLVDACLNGDLEKAKPLQWKVTELERIMAKYGGFAGLASHKPARMIVGRPCGVPRKPIPILDKETVSKLESDIHQSGVLADQPHGWA